MLIGYMRVSKADGSQSTDLQRDALRAAGVATRRLYEDRASGRLDARPGLDAALKALRRGDTLIVWKLDRLGRDLRHLRGCLKSWSLPGKRFIRATQGFNRKARLSIVCRCISITRSSSTPSYFLQYFALDTLKYREL